MEVKMAKSVTDLTGNSMSLRRRVVVKEFNIIL